MIAVGGSWSVIQCLNHDFLDFLISVIGLPKSWQSSNPANHGSDTPQPGHKLIALPVTLSEP
jgi:hypothetical protein